MAFSVVLGLCSEAEPATRYVSALGDDTNAGLRVEKPLRTIQAAVKQLGPGDTLLIRGGVYRESVIFPQNGEPSRPITVKPYDGEQVVVTGCEPVTGRTRHKNNIWKAAMPWTLGTGRNQVFYGDEVMIEARFPNQPAPGLEMPVSGLSKLWPTFGEFSNPDPANQPQRVVSKLLEGQPVDYWKGALYYGVHYGGWSAQTGVIEGSKPGEISVGDRTVQWWSHASQHPEEGRGMIVGHMNALDEPGEWHWQDNTLFLIAPDGGEPTKPVVAKRRQLAFDLSGREYIIIEGLHVLGASVRMEDSANCVVDRCSLSYISHFTRHYEPGQVEHGRDTIKSGETGIFISGHDNAFVNCSIRFSAGAGIHLRGYHHTIRNCLIDEVSYTAHYLNAITDAVRDFRDYESLLVGGHVITFNTMRNAGRHFFNFSGNGTSLHSRDRGPMDYAATLFAHNHLYNGMLQTRDAGFITSFHTSGGTLNGLRSQLAYNVMHDCYDISAMRWNKLGMVYLDNGSRDVDVHHNLFWAAPGSLQAAFWFNPPNTNIGEHDNVFHGLFTRNSAELRPEDFPNGEPFRFGHNFDLPPPTAVWPQLETRGLEAEQCTSQAEGVARTVAGITNLKDGDWFAFGDVDFTPGWQTIVMRFASDRKEMNADRTMRASPRHLKATDPLVLEAKDRSAGKGVAQNWGVLQVSARGWMQFAQVPLGEGYQRFRAVCGNSRSTPRRVEVRLDRPDGPLVGQANLEQTDMPRRGSIQTFKEVVGDLSTAAIGTRDVFFLGVADDGQTVAEFEYFRFERYRGKIGLEQNAVRLELRVDSKDGEWIGELFPRFTGGAAVFRDLVATLEPTHGVRPLFVVVRSALHGVIGPIDRFTLQKATQPLDWRGLGIIPTRRGEPGSIVLPAATNRPRTNLTDRYAPTAAMRPFFNATRLTSRPVGDGDAKEWSSRTFSLSETLEGAPSEDTSSSVGIGYDNDAFYVAVKTPINDPSSLKVEGHLWRATDAMEIAFQSVHDEAPILSLHGWPDGYFRAPVQAGVAVEAANRLAAAVEFKAAVGKDAWTGEWRIPFAACGLPPGFSQTLLCNLTVRNTARATWRTWNFGGGATYDLRNNGGALVFGGAAQPLNAGVKQGLLVWLDASDRASIEIDEADGVTGWKDKSGHGRHAKQSTPGFRPRYLTSGLNGKAALRFSDSAKTRLELSDLSDRPITATVFIVITKPEVGQAGNPNQRVFTSSDGKNNDYQCGLLSRIEGFRTGGPWIMVDEGSDRWAKSVRVGCFSPKYQTFFNGYLSEVLVFDRKLSQEERSLVLSYLAAKWDGQ